MNGSDDTRSTPRSDEAPDRLAVVVALNDAAAVYEALAEQIRGSAVGWSDTALAQLERGLLDRYGPMLGGHHPVRRLVRLAAKPRAA
jgi:hypothetical protein